MEASDPRSQGAMVSPAVDPVVPATQITTRTEVVDPAPAGVVAVSWTTMPPAPATRRESVVPVVPVLTLRPMAPWRIAGAVASLATFAAMGWQAQRVGADRPWSHALMGTTVAAGLVAAMCVVVWTRSVTKNARRLVGPGARGNLAEPKTVVLTWIAPFAFAAVAAGIVAVVGVRSDRSTEPGVTVDADAVSAVPLAVALVALLGAIPLTYRPLHHLAAVVRQVGGYTVRVAQWMWVPVVMALVGLASLVALRFAGVDDTPDGGAADAAGWAPLWLIAVVAAAPCAVTVLLAWRAGSSVEDAITVAASRRHPGASTPWEATRVDAERVHRRVATSDRTTRIDLVPGTEALRFGIATLMAGLALSSVVGAVVTGMLWLSSRETGVVPTEVERTWDALDALRAVSVAVTMALLAVVAAWTFVIVLNVRMTSGRRRNPAIAALAWPVAAGVIWWIADRVIVDGSVGVVVVGFAAQAVALAVPFLVLERSADAIGARRTPLRIAAVLGVVLLVHVQGLGGLSRLPDSVTTTEIGRLVGYLAIGALIQLCSTLVMTEACRAMSRTCRHEAEHHNMLVDQRGNHRPEPVVGR